MADPSSGATQPYEIRRYEPADRPDVRSLFERVWGADRGTDWLAHTYERNPYADGPSMIVADAAGSVVGARPFVPFPMRSGGVDFRAAYLNNAMVHPDHRRNGLFTRMMERTVDELGSAGVALLFNFANEKSAPGYRELGFEEVGRGPRKSLCVRRPGRYVRERFDPPLGGAVEALANAAMRGYRSLRRLGVSVPETWLVDRRAGIPAETLAGLYGTRPAPRLHTRREAAVYRWLADDPHWQYETYLVSTGRSPAAAAVVRTPAASTRATAEIVDVVPPTPPAGGAALLEAVFTAHRDAPAVSATGPVVNERLLPPALLSAFGFLPADAPLLAAFTADEDTAFVHAVADAPELRDALDPHDPENWRVRIH